MLRVAGGRDQSRLWSLEPRRQVGRAQQLYLPGKKIPISRSAESSPSLP